MPNICWLQLLKCDFICCPEKLIDFRHQLRLLWRDFRFFFQHFADLSSIYTENSQQKCSSSTVFFGGCSANKSWPQQHLFFKMINEFNEKYWSYLQSINNMKHLQNYFTWEENTACSVWPDFCGNYREEPKLLRKCKQLIKYPQCVTISIISDVNMSVWASWGVECC